jgi:gamma-glutamyl-gamma-aminobutyrate hydrolase PuuD
MAQPKVFIAHPSGVGYDAYANMFLRMGWEVVTTVGQADLIQFTGGADVNPSLYGHAKHPTTMCDMARDLRDAQYFEMGKLLGKCMAGICRGGQFLNVSNGGELIQHVDGHAVGSTHLVVDSNTGATIEVSSTHHQMMLPSSKAVVVAVARESSYKLVFEEKEVDVQHKMLDDIEVLYYDEYNCLCFQPHPEFSEAKHCREYYFACLKNYLGLSA